VCSSDLKSAPQPVDSVPRPDLNDKAQRGRYLVAVVSANISPDLHTGIGRWTEQDFVNRFAQYREYVEHGSPLSGAEADFETVIAGLPLEHERQQWSGWAGGPL
jgi:hypothetical protein